MKKFLAVFLSTVMCFHSFSYAPLAEETDLSNEAGEVSEPEVKGEKTEDPADSEPEADLTQTAPESEPGEEISEETPPKNRNIRKKKTPKKKNRKKTRKKHIGNRGLKKAVRPWFRKRASNCLCRRTPGKKEAKTKRR